MGTATDYHNIEGSAGFESAKLLSARPAQQKITTDMGRFAAPLLGEDEAVDEHSMRVYDAELKSLDAMVAQMGGLAEHALGQAIDALLNRNPDLAEVTLEKDKDIDRLERAVDENAVSIITPAAGRQRSQANRYGHPDRGDLERIGDLAKNMAKRAIAIAGEQHPKQVMTGFKHIGEAAMRQLKEVLDAYSQRDADAAVRVWQRDQEIDAMYNSLYAELLQAMMERAAAGRPLRPPAVRRQEHRADRRPRDQHRRDDLLFDPRQGVRRGAARNRIAPARRCLLVASRERKGIALPKGGARGVNDECEGARCRGRGAAGSLAPVQSGGGGLSRLSLKPGRRCRGDDQG